MGSRRLPEVCGLVVQTLVALGGDIPAEIALHAVVHEVLPVLLVIVSILCVAAGHIQLVGVVAGKGKAVAVTVLSWMESRRPPVSRTMGGVP